MILIENLCLPPTTHELCNNQQKIELTPLIKVYTFERVGLTQIFTRLFLHDQQIGKV